MGVNYTTLGANHLGYDLGALVIELNAEFHLCGECHDAMLASYDPSVGCPDDDCTPEWIKKYASYTLELTEFINDVVSAIYEFLSGKNYGRRARMLGQEEELQDYCNAFCK